MKDGTWKKPKLSWSKSLVRRWFNIKNKAHDFNSTGVGRGGDAEWRSSIAESTETCPVKKSKTERLFKRTRDQVGRGKIDLDPAQVTETLHYRIFVATWNVGGKSPPSNLNLDDWLHISPAADIYVLGFQEIVPLNAGNVLGAEDNAPAKKWVALITRTLNNLCARNSSSGSNQTASPIADHVEELNDDVESASTRQRDVFRRSSLQSLSCSLRFDGYVLAPQPRLDRRHSVCDRVMYANRLSDYDSNYRWDGFSDDENACGDCSPSMTAYYSPMPCGYEASSSMCERERSGHLSRYSLVASKQMVGIFLTVWARGDIRGSIRNLKASCVGRGLMGYLGNKGSISISLSLHQTSFCFICSHLTSGQKEGDELRRNSDVMEILRKTRFPPFRGLYGQRAPESILEHDRVIWLGDLNYRIALSYRSVKALVEMRNWKALLEKDQLRIEQRSGRVFQGWNEGRIFFPPTYKYSNNSDQYAGDDTNLREKRRTPAWCDRILWHGKSLNQLSYVRGESRFSDHRPVSSTFVAEVESITHGRVQNLNCSSSHVDFEEHMPYSSSFTELSFF